MADDLDQVGSAWMLDPRARVAMTLLAGREALMADNPDLAMMVAEEILEENHDDLEGFELLVEAAMRCGHAPLAVLAAEQAARKGARNDTLRAAALLAAVRPEEALALATDVVTRAPGEARAHAIRGQALELCGRLAEADEALGEATRLAPDRYPPPLRISAWDPLLVEALGQLDDTDRSAARILGVHWLEVPLPALLDIPGTQFPPLPPTCSGVPYLDGVALFTRNLTRGVSSEDEVVHRIVEVLEVTLADRRGTA